VLESECGKRVKKRRGGSRSGKKRRRRGDGASTTVQTRKERVQDLGLAACRSTASKKTTTLT